MSLSCSLKCRHKKGVTYIKLLRIRCKLPLRSFDKRLFHFVKDRPTSLNPFPTTRLPQAIKVRKMSSFAINSAVSKAAAIIIVTQILNVCPVTITCQVINLLFSRPSNCKTKIRKIKVSMKSPITEEKRKVRSESPIRKSDYTRKKTTPIEPICKLPSAE